MPHYCQVRIKVQNPHVVSTAVGRVVVGLITVWWGGESQLSACPSLTPFSLGC